MELRVDGLAVLAGGLMVLAGGAAGSRLRGLHQTLRRELSGPMERIEKLEVRLSLFEEATATDLRLLQTNVESAADQLQKLRPLELQTRLTVLEQGSAAAQEETRQELQRVDTSLRQALEDLKSLQASDSVGLCQQIGELGVRVSKAAALISELAALQEQLRTGLNNVEGSLQGRLDQADGETEKLSNRIADQEASVQQAIDGMARVALAQEQLTALLEERLGQLQTAIATAQQDTAVRRMQVQTAGGPAVMPPIGMPPGVQAPAGFATVIADLAAVQQQFAERQRAAAAEVFAQPGGGGR